MKRTCQILIALCLPLALCGQVMAQHSGPYVGAFIGGSALMTSTGSDSKGNFNLEFDPALMESGVIGWDLPPGNQAGEGRIELEYSRRSNPLSKVKFVEGDFKGGGDVKVDSLLLNLIGLFRDNRPWSPYAGVGIGAARMEASDFKVTGGPLGSGSSFVFAYQLLIGVDLALNDSLSVDLGYRFFNSMNPKFNEAGGTSFKMEYFSHSLVFGMRYGF